LAGNCHLLPASRMLHGGSVTGFKLRTLYVVDQPRRLCQAGGGGSGPISRGTPSTFFLETTPQRIPKPAGGLPGPQQRSQVCGCETLETSAIPISRGKLIPCPLQLTAREDHQNFLDPRHAASISGQLLSSRSAKSYRRGRFSLYRNRRSHFA
jgi:hypothetical protein